MTDRPLPPAGPFAADDGSADPRVAAALAAWATGVLGTDDARAVQQALVGTRVLVPVVAALGVAGTTAEGTVVEKTAHMSTVTVTGADGRRALPVFTSVAALSRWDPTARPFPASASDAARGAYEDGVEALLVDPSADGVLVVEGPAMLALAEGRPWLPAAEDPDLLEAVDRALVGIDGLAGFSVGPGGEADLLVTLRVEPSRARDVAAVAAVAATAAERLAGVDLVRERLGRGIDLAVSPPDR